MYTVLDDIENIQSYSDLQPHTDTSSQPWQAMLLGKTSKRRIDAAAWSANDRCQQEEQ